MNDVTRGLIESATEARANAYAPYSVYQVGAAILGSDGRVYTGCNVENVSYGAAVCAERTAAFKMVSEGCRELAEVAVVTVDGGAPCGLCRQVLAEFSPSPEEVLVHCAEVGGPVATYSLAELYPHGFRPKLRNP